MDPEAERYRGERRGLACFLGEMHPLVAELLGPEHLLLRAIDRAQASQQLQHLRHARQLFNRLPRDVRQQLTQQIVTQPEPAVTKPEPDYNHPKPAACLSISSTHEASSDGPWRIELSHEWDDPPALRVLIKAGTLPSTAARSLRDIADRLEQDKQLLSKHHWRDSQIKAVDGQSDVDVG